MEPPTESEGLLSCFICNFCTLFTLPYVTWRSLMDPRTVLHYCFKQITQYSVFILHFATTTQLLFWPNWPSSQYWPKVPWLLKGFGLLFTLVILLDAWTVVRWYLLTYTDQKCMCMWYIGKIAWNFWTIPHLFFMQVPLLKKAVSLPRAPPV